MGTALYSEKKASLLACFFIFIKPIQQHQIKKCGENSPHF
ncbi:hypothetical protein HMPREF9064_1241 [Aggregatibacter segnis ATCC 33393]|uniref:Uncharacterized protein n=1 Tax=Aggregatibacter segnis ATCC 33393 TaxID=888057 RepID=E6KYK9_9PAST|nr:hypothetical protein HMPREF9064_1241 [Aggregatibacter segnis ATCC 33393]